MLGRANKFKSELGVIAESFKRDGSFTRNFSYLFSGKVFTMLLSFVATPILTRLYTPDAYGYFAIFNAIVLSYGTIACLGYDGALIVVKGEDTFYNLVAGCVCIIAVTMSLLAVGLSVLLYVPPIASIVDFNKGLDGKFVALTLLGGIMYVMLNIQSSWNVRRRQFKVGAISGVLNQIVSRIISLFLGIFSIATSYGLIIGEMSGRLNSIILYVRINTLKEYRLAKEAISYKGILDTLKSLTSYPKYILPTRYIGLLQAQLPIFFITSFFGMNLLGNYGLAMSVIQLPIFLLKNTTSPVILEKLSNAEGSTKQVGAFVKRLFNILVIFATPFFISLIIAAPHIFPFFFGEHWYEAGVIAGVLSVFLLIDVLDMFTGPILQVYQKERSFFGLKLIQFLISSMSMIPGAFLEDIKLMLLGFGFANFCFGAYIIQKSFKILSLRIYPLMIVMLLLLLTVYLFQQMFL